MPPSSPVRLEMEGRKTLARALKVMGDVDAPFIRAALEEGAKLIGDTARGYARGSIASGITYEGLKGTGVGSRAIVKARHPGSKSMEFGRTLYPSGYRRTGGGISGGTKVKRAGQRAKPYIGVKNRDAALGASLPQITGEIFPAAIAAEWARLLGQGGD